MPTILNTAADAIIKRIHRSSFYYKKYNNTLSYRLNKLYIDYARECSQKYAAGHPGVTLAPSPITDTPAVAFRSVFSKEKARAISEKMGQLIDSQDPAAYFPPHKQGGGLMAEIRSPLKVLGTDTLEAFRDPAVHDALLRFFRGNYRIQGAAAWRSFATKEEDAVSWLWHSDTNPPFTC